MSFSIVENNLPLAHQALEKYGDRNQIIKTMEECGELIHALSRKLIDGSFYNTKVIEELADVQIMLEQMIYLFGEDQVKRLIELKKERLQVKLGV